MSKLGSIKDKVEYILNQYSETRDDDYTLYIAYAWENYNLDLEKITAKELFRKMSHGTIEDFSTVSRARRLVQELAAKRGDTYLCGDRDKKTKLAKEVSDEVIALKEKNGRGESETKGYTT